MRGAAARFGWLAALIASAVVVILGAGIFLYDHARRDVIAHGVSVGGVPVGGLHEAAAREKLQRVLVARLDRPVTVRAGSRSWSLSAREAGVRVDVGSMVARAVKASREGSIFSRTARGLFGGSVNRNIPLVVSYSHAAVRTITAQVRSAVNRPPRDATVRPGAGGLAKVPGQDGLRVESGRLGARVQHALTEPGPSRTVVVSRRSCAAITRGARISPAAPANAIVLRMRRRVCCIGSYLGQGLRVLVSASKKWPLSVPVR